MHQSLLIYNQTVIHPVALAATLIAGVLMIVLPRRYALVPFLFAAIFIPMQQQLVLASLDFHMLRILVLFGWLRLWIRSEYHGLKLHALDVVLILWALARTVSYVLLWQTENALINRLGGAFDALGIFFLMRHLIRNFDDVAFAIKTLAVICVPLAAAMLIERATGRNAFAVFGGVPELTLIRDGKLRCQGAFKHPILAGAFGASLMPLFLALWWRDRKAKATALVGLFAATIVTLSTASSGPALVYVAGLAGFAMWNFRKIMATILWLVACTMVALQLIMNAPIWALMWRVKVFGASTGYHRYNLFDQFINRFGEWWLIGTQSYSNWGRQLFDVTNQYVRIGVDGGFFTLLFFLGMIILGLTGVHRAWQQVENRRHQILAWALGASLFSHAVSFMGVAYFDQIIVLWYALLAMIVAVIHTAAPSEQEVTEPEAKPAMAALPGTQFA